MAFLYAVDSIGFLSKPSTIHYSKIYRSSINFGMKYQLTTLSGGDEIEEEKMTYGSMLMSLGLFVSKHAEVGLDVPVSKSPAVKFKDFWAYYSGAGVFSNLHIYIGDANKPLTALKLGLKYNLIGYDLFKDLEDFPYHLSSISFLLGVQGSIERFNNGLQLDYVAGVDGALIFFQKEIGILTGRSIYAGIRLSPNFKFFSN